MLRISGWLARFVVVVALGGLALGSSLALLVRAAGSVDGAATYGSVLPELTPLAQRSIVYDRHGGVLAVLFAEEDREPVTLDAVPDHLVQAVLAIEDRNFYEHNGFDLKGTLRALFRNVEEGGVREGGSTITQQLVKVGLLDDNDRTLDRKVREAVLAMRLEQELDKDEILERYLNTIYFGGGAYGIRAAAERYFDKQPAELFVHESALLAGLIANPEGASPIEYPERARRRRSEVLRSMREVGVLNQAQVEFADATPLPTRDTTFGNNNPRTDNFFEAQVRRELLDDERLGASYQERYQTVFRGGLRIHTTYDPRMQILAEAAVRATLPEGIPFTAALVAIENSNGAVRALVGGNQFSVDEQFNLATQGVRQTGSSFKSITLAAALAAGYSPNDLVNASCPAQFDLPGQSTPWRVSGPGGGYETLAQATRSSHNCAFARLALALGPERIVEMGQRLGIESELGAYPSITLGTQPTSVLEMAGAYSVLAADGVRHPPMFVSRVETRDGEVLFENGQDPEQVLDPEIARTETSILEGVITSGTGTRARLDRPAAGKTGTAQQYRDAWFVGYTPQFTAAVWMGNPQAQVSMDRVGEFSPVFGGTYPALIWKAFMEPAHEGLEELEFPEPDTSRWPRASRIDEDGRAEPRAYRSSPSPTAAPPTSVDVPTVPPPVPATRVPPTTVPPTTAPPPTTTVPPTTAPPEE